MPPPAVASPSPCALCNTMHEEQDQDKIIKPQIPQKDLPKVTPQVLCGAEQGIQQHHEIVLLHCPTNSFSSPRAALLLHS